MKSFVNPQILDLDDEPVFEVRVMFDTPEEMEDFKKNDGSRKRFRQMVYEKQGGKEIGKMPVTVTSLLEKLINDYVKLELPSDTMVCLDILKKFHNIPVGETVDLSDEQLEWIEDSLKKEVEIWKDREKGLKENRMIALLLAGNLPFVCETLGIKLSALDKKK